MTKHLVANGFRRPDDLAFDRETAGERRVEALEQMNVLGFLAREIEQRAHAIIVIVQLRPSMIEHEWQNELFNQSEHAQIFVRRDLVEDALLLGRQGLELGG